MGSTGGCASDDMRGLEIATTPIPGSADVPAKAWREFWMPRYREKLEQARREGDAVRVVLLGDSNTHYWETNGKQVYDEVLTPYHVLNLAASGDRVQHWLWIVGENEPWDRIRPGLVVVTIGTNNLTHDDLTSPAAVAEAVRRGLAELRRKLPRTAIALCGVPPGGKTPDHPHRAPLRDLDRRLAAFADPDHEIFFIDLYDPMLDPDGTLSDAMLTDNVHLAEPGYRIWVELLQPYLEKYARQ